jgi:hypothetical protein
VTLGFTDISVDVFHPFELRASRLPGALESEQKVTHEPLWRKHYSGAIQSRFGRTHIS